ncbi:MAG: hypothetical protein ICV34_07325, partial [Rubrobacter sp.]|nr:hypothetical protein [Rubrobacter sp.]
HIGAEVRLESFAHDAHVWATEEEWRSLDTWYTDKELDVLWETVREMSR